MQHVTGWDTGLNQDYCRALAIWFATRLAAREVVRRFWSKSENNHE